MAIEATKPIAPPIMMPCPDVAKTIARVKTDHRFKAFAAYNLKCNGSEAKASPSFKGMSRFRDQDIGQILGVVGHQNVI